MTFFAILGISLIFLNIIFLIRERRTRKMSEIRASIKVVQSETNEMFKNMIRIQNDVNHLKNILEFLQGKNRKD